MRTKSMARDVARLVHGAAAEVRCRRHYRRSESGAFESCYLAEAFARQAVRGRGLTRGRRVVLESAAASTPARAYDALYRLLHPRAYVDRAEHVADRGAAGIVGVTVGPHLRRDELPRDAVVCRAFALEASGDTETVRAALDLVSALLDRSPR